MMGSCGAYQIPDPSYYRYYHGGGGCGVRPDNEHIPRRSMKENLKEYFNKHKDIIFTAGLIILVDHFLFKGALRTRMQDMVGKMITNAEHSIEAMGKPKEVPNGTIDSPKA